MKKPNYRKFKICSERIAICKSAIPASSWIASQSIADAYAPILFKHIRGSVLDVGCGKMPFEDLYSQLSNYYFGVDWSPEGEADVINNLNEGLSFADKSFDVVVCTDVIEHIFQYKNLMSEICRVLKPKGYLILGVPFLYGLHEEPHDYFRYTRHGLRKLLGDAGLAVHRINETGGPFDVASDLAAKALSPVPPLAAGVYFAWRLARLSPIGERLSTFGAARLPLGYIVSASRPA